MRFLLCTLAAMTVATPLYAYDDFPASTPGYPFQRSTLTSRSILIPPYRHIFRARVYSTPPRQPYYNVPPYAVIAPY